MAEKTYVVTAACAVVYNEDRSAAVTVPRGGKVPPGADPEHVQLLLDRGLIAEGESSGGLDVDPGAAPPFPAPDGDRVPGERPARRSTAARES